MQAVFSEVWSIVLAIISLGILGSSYHIFTMIQEEMEIIYFEALNNVSKNTEMPIVSADTHTLYIKPT